LWIHRRSPIHSYFSGKRAIEHDSEIIFTADGANSLDVNMIRNIRELIDILTREQALFREYLGLLNEQQEHLIQNDMDKIRASTDRINTLAHEAADLEDSRRAILSRISGTASAEPEKLIVSRLLAIFDNPKFRDLERFRDAMLEIHQRIDDQKARNELLIEQSIKMISQTPWTWRRALSSMDRELARATKIAGRQTC
jgi:hypothetical protein